jgi:hypothetical protein
MEHREPLRIGPGDRRPETAIDSPRDLGSARARPLALVGVARHVAPRRLALLLSAGVATLLALGYLASLATVAAVGWLHRQPFYQLPIDQIRLEPGPPLWYRGGRDAFLEGIRRSGHQTKPIGRLDLTPDKLAAIFKNCPWIEEVRVTYPPDGITVHLRYREPVAYVQIFQGEQLLVDSQGTILPPGDVDETKLDPARLTRITAQHLESPADPTPGVTWKSKTAETDSPRPDQRILAAAKLAAFLRDQTQRQSRPDLLALRVGEIIVTDFENRGLFLLNDEGQIIWWRSAPGEERPGEPTAVEKWKILRKWGESSKRRLLPERDYWRFSQTELYAACPHDGRHLTKPVTDDRAGANSDRSADGSG